MGKGTARVRKAPPPPGMQPGPRPYAPKDSPETRALILEGLRAGKTKKDACEDAGVPRRTVTDWEKADPVFAAAMVDAYDEGTDVLEREAQRRAVEGVEEVTVVESNGPKGAMHMTTKVTRYSDTLLNIMLQGRRPNKYRKSAVELSGPDGGPINAKLTVEFTDAPQVKK